VYLLDGEEKERKEGRQCGGERSGRAAGGGEGGREGGEEGEGGRGLASRRSGTIMQDARAHAVAHPGSREGRMIVKGARQMQHLLVRDRFRADDGERAAAGGSIISLD